MNVPGCAGPSSHGEFGRVSRRRKRTHEEPDWRRALVPPELASATLAPLVSVAPAPPLAVRSLVVDVAVVLAVGSAGRAVARSSLGAPDRSPSSFSERTRRSPAPFRARDLSLRRFVSPTSQDARPAARPAAESRALVRGRVQELLGEDVGDVALVRCALGRERMRRELEAGRERRRRVGRGLWRAVHRRQALARPSKLQQDSQESARG